MFVFNSEFTLQEHLSVKSTGFSFASFEKYGLGMRFGGIKSCPFFDQQAFVDLLV